MAVPPCASLLSVEVAGLPVSQPGGCRSMCESRKAVTAEMRASHRELRRGILHSRHRASAATEDGIRAGNGIQGEVKVEQHDWVNIAERYKRLYTPAVCDVLDSLGLRHQAMDPAIRPLDR